MAVFEKFGDETYINLPAELTEKVILIARHYLEEIGTMSIFSLPQSPFLFYKKALKEGWKRSWFVGLCV